MCDRKITYWLFIFAVLLGSAVGFQQDSLAQIFDKGGKQRPDNSEALREAKTPEEKEILAELDRAGLYILGGSPSIIITDGSTDDILGGSSEDTFSVYFGNSPYYYPDPVPVTDELLEKVVKLGRLRTLRLNGTNITDDQLAYQSEDLFPRQRGDWSRFPT